uniref:Uncharacterized protein n=1 Tax=viral metagenome TaxID=1070528 RepID=A0A6C0H6H2_9ZZZZ
MPVNFILLRHGNQLIQDNLDGTTYYDVFNRNLINIYLNKYEITHNIILTYDDIEAFVIFENLNESITDFPKACKFIEINNSRLLNVSFDKYNIEKFILRSSYLSDIPLNIEKCEKLIELVIIKSNLTYIDTYFPNNIKILNVSYNKIKNIDYSKIPKSTKIIANNNDFPNNHPIIYPFYNKPYIRNTTQIISYREIVQDIIDGNTKSNVLLDNSQTVHLSSITKSVTKSVSIINNYIINNNLSKCENYVEDILRTVNNSEKIKKFLNSQTKEKHSLFNLNYHELLSKVWQIILHHPKKLELINRLHTELYDSIGYCFTGRMNRLVNVLVTYIDGIQVSISKKEEIQINIEKIIHNLNKLSNEPKHSHKTLFIQYLDEANKLFDYPDNDPNDDDYISNEYKQSWINAFYDFQPEPDIIIVLRINIDNYKSNNDKIISLIEHNSKLVDEYYSNLKNYEIHGLEYNNTVNKIYKLKNPLINPCDYDYGNDYECIPVYKSFENKIYLVKSDIYDISLSIGTCNDDNIITYFI